MFSLVRKTEPTTMIIWFSGSHTEPLCCQVLQRGDRRMGKYLVKRVLMMLLTLFLIALLTFVLMHAVPGGPFTGDKQVSKQVLEALNE